MPRWKKKIVITEEVIKELPPVPSMMEQAMAALMNATASNTKVLERVAESLDSMNQKLDHPQEIKDHQLDLDQQNKQKPFKVQMKYYVEQRTQDLGDGIWDYEDPIGRAYPTREAAVNFWTMHYGAGLFRILEIEAPMPS